METSRHAGMPAAEVARVVAWLEEREVVYQCNGGWAVDALAGVQTRAHGDLDVFLDERAMPEALAALAACGYRIVEDWRPARIELRHGAFAVDLHPMRITDAGDGVQHLPDGGALVHEAARRVRGMIGGTSVVVADAARLIELRAGYPARAVDVHDLSVLRGLCPPA